MKIFDGINSLILVKDHFQAKRIKEGYFENYKSQILIINIIM